MRCPGEGGGVDCHRRNFTYATICVPCKRKRDQSKVVEKDDLVGTAFYIGESGRSGYERGKEHSEDYIRRKEDSHILKHEALEHPGEKVTFQMKVLRKHPTALSRQVHEATLIESYSRENILNSKNSFNRCGVPRLSVMVGDRMVGTAVDSGPTDREVERLMSDQRNLKKKKKSEEQEIDRMAGQPTPKRKRYCVGGDDEGMENNNGERKYLEYHQTHGKSRNKAQICFLSQFFSLPV